jgi:bifunctional UDP-N-acetylglucosamine pyrophosphorylase/glucosamine-1-phosphate N-acetyltransferase
MNDLAIVILAAGVGKRMKSGLVKVLHPLCGRPLVEHVVEAVVPLEPWRIVVVVGRQAEQVRAALLGRQLEFVYQDEPRGTADAVMRTVESLSEHRGDVIVLAGDVPLLRSETIDRLLRHHRDAEAHATVLTTMLANPFGYGRIVRRDGRLAGIVEERDADEGIRQISEVNTGAYAFRADRMFAALEKVRPENDQEEFYLTDVIRILTEEGACVEALVTEDSQEVMGINDRQDLARAAQVLRQRLLDSFMLSGVTVTDPLTTFIDCDVTIGLDTTIHPFTLITRGSVIGEGCSIGPHAVVNASRVGDGASVSHFVVLNRWEVARGEVVEPFQNLSR